MILRLPCLEDCRKYTPGSQTDNAVLLLALSVRLAVVAARSCVASLLGGGCWFRLRRSIFGTKNKKSSTRLYLVGH